MTASAAPRVRTFAVAEVFGPTLQGEGELVGVPTLFVRFGGCDYRCSWCDSLHAVLPQYRAEWARLTEGQILARLLTLQPPPLVVTLSGGNPALFPLGELVTLLQGTGYRVAVETQGSRWPVWFAGVDHLVVSPKPPSSGEAPDRASLLPKVLTHFRTRPGTISLKIPVFTDADLDFAGTWRGLGPPLSLSVGNPDVRVDAEPDAHHALLLERTRWLADAVLRRGWSDVRVLPQLHVLLHANRRGV